MLRRTIITLIVMNSFHGLKIMGIEIVIIMLVKCIAASPALSRVQRYSEDEPESSATGKHPSVPPWAQANGHGKHKRNDCFLLKGRAPFRNRQITFYIYWEDRKGLFTWRDGRSKHSIALGRS